MSDEAPPIRATLVGRDVYVAEFDEDPPPPDGRALPSGCMRALQIPGQGCSESCAGVQRDGGCLAELVRGRESWSMTIDPEGFWVLNASRS